MWKTPAAAALALVLALAAPAAAQQAEPTAAQLAAAGDLMEAAHDRDNLRRAFELGLEQGYSRARRGEPVPAWVRDMVLRFFDEHLAWSELQPLLAREYAKRYTVEEMRQIAAFLRTPAGRKMTSVSPEMTIAVSGLLQARMGPDMDELGEEIMQRAAGEADGDQAPPPAPPPPPRP